MFASHSWYRWRPLLWILVLKHRNENELSSHSYLEVILLQTQSKHKTEKVSDSARYMFYLNPLSHLIQYRNYLWSINKQNMNATWTPQSIFILLSLGIANQLHRGHSFNVVGKRLKFILKTYSILKSLYCMRT